jgi:hypothetical protein
MQLYHMRVFVLGKIDPMCGFFATPSPRNVEKSHPLRLHIEQRNVELLNLPSRPTGSSEYPNRSWQRLVAN